MGDTTAAYTLEVDRRRSPVVDGDTPAAHLLNAIVRNIQDGDPAAARAAVALVEPDLFEVPHERDLYRALAKSLELCQAPGLLEVKAIIEHDDQAASPVEDVLAALYGSLEVAYLRSWNTRAWVEAAAAQLHTRRSARQAREVGARLVEAAERELAGRPAPAPDRWTIPTDDLAEAERLARELRDARPGNGRPAARGLLQMIDNWSARKAEKIITTGFRPIDRAFGGGLPVGLHGIAAAPGVGKSALALQLALGALLHNPDARVLWFRGEMTDDLVLSKAIAVWSKIRTTSAAGPPHADDLLEVGITDALRRSSATKPVRMDMAAVIGDRFVSIDPPLTPTEIERRVDEYAPALVVVDYLQLVEVGGFKDRRAEFDHVVRRLAATSARHDLAIVVVSSVAGHTHTGSDIGRLTKESNALDFQAHTFVSLWPQGDKDDDPRRVLFKIHKNRTGRLGDEELEFDGTGQFYAPLAVDELEAFTGYALP